MIARLWRGRAEAKNASDYVRHISETVFPSLRDMPRHRDEQLLRRAVEDHVEFLAVTSRDSLDNIRQFAGPDIDVARIEPRAEELLSDYDRFARHFEIAHVVSDPSR